jgi:hypothetical protein
MRMAYIKPEVTRVNLVPSEAVLTACRTPQFGGPDPSGGYCYIFPDGWNCKEQGS